MGLINMRNVMFMAALVAACEDNTNGFTDSYGDGCDWYAANPDGCGNYDTDTFTCADMCCVCGGGVANTCTDTDYGAGDSFGDGCDWYWDGIGCGSYEDDDF